VAQPSSKRGDAFAHAALVAVPALLGFALCLFAPQVLGDGDTYWHVAAGQWMLGHHQVIHADSFSFTFAGKPWDTNEWLAEVVMALTYRLAGWAGVVGLTGLACAATLGLTARRLGRGLSPVGVVVALALVAGCLAPSLLARPHFLALPLLVLWTGALLDARAQDRAPSPAWLLLMVVWANAHASFMFGIALIGPFALEALLAEPKAWPRVVRDWGLFGVGAVLAALLTPHGLDGLLFPLRVSDMGSLASITEWRSPDFQRLPPVEIALLAGLFVLLYRGIKVPPVRLLMLLVLVYMTLGHVRHETLFALIGAPILGELLADRRHEPAPGTGRIALLAALVGAAALMAARLAIPFPLPEGPTAPVRALAQVPAELRARPVLNGYDLGGYLIFRGVRTFIDGRTDMYGDAFNARYDAIMRPDMAAFDKAVRQYGIDWTFLSPSSPLAARLDTDPAWRRLYADRYAVVHVRRSP
jgi:hypothetical protein